MERERARALLGAGMRRTEPIVSVVASLGPGGSQRQATTTALALHERALPVAVLAADLSSSPSRTFFRDGLETAGVAVHVLSAPADAAPIRAAERAPEEPSRRLAALVQALPRRLRDLVLRYHAAFRTLRPSVVHAWTDLVSVPAGLAARLAAVPRIVLAGRGMSPHRTLPALQGALLPAYRHLALEPGVVLVNNSVAGARDYAAWLDCGPARIAVVYNGLDPARHREPGPDAIRAFRTRHGLTEGDCVVGSLVRFASDKRPMLWLETAAHVVARMPPARFLLFGTGSLRGEMERFLSERGLAERVRLCGPVEDSALALASFDLTLLTSPLEGTPNVLLESQALGVPVVATGEGGVAESLEHGATGLHLPDATAPELAEAVAGLLSDPARRHRMGAAGRAFVAARFGRDRMVEQTLRLYGMG